MIAPQEQLRLDEAFDRIEGTILPCISMMLDSLIDTTRDVGFASPRSLATELQTLAREVEHLTQSVERRAHIRKLPGSIRSAA